MLFRTLCSVIVAAVAAGHGMDARAEGLQPEQEAALRAIARGEPVSWPGASPEQAKALYEKSEAQLKDHQDHHLPHGLSVDVFWTDKERTKPFRYETVGDSACWAGHYLAAVALKYKVTQDAGALGAVRAALDKLDLLTRVTGRTGYIARYAGPADDEAYREYYKVYGRGEDPDRPGLGRWAYKGAEPHTDLVWLGNSSRDTYDGFNFGIAAAWENVADEGVRAKIRSIVETVAQRLVADNFYVIDGQGHMTRPTASWRLAWMRTIATVSPQKHPDVVAAYYDGARKAIQAPGQAYPITYKEYFANNLAMVRMYVLCTLENDPEVKAGWRNQLRQMYGSLRNHLNAHFAAIYLAATGDQDADAAATLQGQLIDMPGPPRWMHAVDHRNDPNYPLREGGEYTQYALLAHEQVPTDFLWQRSPVLSHGSQDAPYEFPGIDLFLPYWMGRAAGVLPAP